MLSIRPLGLRQGHTELVACAHNLYGTTARPTTRHVTPGGAWTETVLFNFGVFQPHVMRSRNEGTFRNRAAGEEAVLPAAYAVQQAAI